MASSARRGTTAAALANKQHGFDDFIAAGEYLVEHGYTTPAQLAVDGASNGGLLTGAMAVQRPELFRAVVSGVPLLDMIRYPKFGLGAASIADVSWARRHRSAARVIGSGDPASSAMSGISSTCLDAPDFTHASIARPTCESESAGKNSFSSGANTSAIL